MNNFTYKELQKIQENTTRKLIKYINEFIEKDRSLDSIEFYYPDFDKKKTMMAFNVWVSIDYKTKSDKSFIEHMLEEKPGQLSELEKDILIERNKSYISLFEIVQIHGENIEVFDLLTRKKHLVWDPNVANMLKVKDLIFARIGKIINYKGFIGNISFLPPSVKNEFISEVFLDYNYTRIKNSNLSMKEYLKEYSVNLYKMYTESVYEVMESDDSTSILYGELEEFENYLQLKLNNSTVKKHVTNLIHIYEYLLIEDNLILSHLDKVDFNELLDLAIKDNLIQDQAQFSSYISTLKLYFEFLKTKDKKYLEAYKNILEISRDRFLYMGYIKESKPVFKINSPLVNRIANLFNEEAFDFIMDYERFLLYVMGNPLELTEKRKHIKRKHLIYLNGIMENTETITKKAPNQKDFLILNLFYQFSLDQGLVQIDKSRLSIREKSSDYLKLNDEEKFTLFIEYIWAHSLEAKGKEILNTLSDLEENTFYPYKELIDINIESSREILNSLKYSNLIGLLEYISKPDSGIKINSFGMIVFSVLTNKDDIANDHGRLINFNDYKKE